MKHIILLAFTLSAFISSAQLSRNDNRTYEKQAVPAALFNKTPQLPSHWTKPWHSSHSTNASRSQDVSFALDYGALDEAYNNNVNQGTGFWYRDEQFSFLVINRSLPKDSVGYKHWAFTWFPRIIDIDNNPTWPHTEYSADKIQMSLDTIFVSLGHLHYSSLKDTIVISVWDMDDMQNISFDTGATGTLYGRVTVVTDTSLWGGTGEGTSPGTFVFGTYPFVPTSPINIPQGKKFLVQVDYFGPAQDQFLIGSARRNDCASQCGASIPYVNYFYNSTIKDINSLTVSSYYDDESEEYADFPSVFTYIDCNTNGSKDQTCEEIYQQNYDIFPHVKATIPQFYVEATTTSVRPCPGSTVSLLANGGGSSATPYTYYWTSTSGTLSSTSDQQVNLTLSDKVVNDTVIITLIDANSVSTKDTVVIVSGGIKIGIANLEQPVVMQCGGSATIATTISGNTQGRIYSWSTGEQGSNRSSVTVDKAQTVSVTVTNGVQCTAMASVAVTYEGASNTVNFNTPIANGQGQFAGCLLQFKNTSTYYAAPWTATWTMEGPTSQEITITDGNQNLFYTYTSPGVYAVTLTMDSAGCTFSTTKSVTITTKPNNQTCSVGIESLTENNALVTLFPNPAGNELFITADGFQPEKTAIYDMSGRKLSEGKFTNRMDITALSVGMYFIEVRNADRIARKRLQKVAQ